jgi:hypothetical protein
MMSRIASNLLLSSAGMLFCSAIVPTGAALAGSVLENTQETTVGAQATYDNNWAQSFQVTGNATVNGGGASIAPFATTDALPLPLPNSGTAVLNATVSIGPNSESANFQGNVEGSASISPAGSSNSVTLNQSPIDGVPAISLDLNNQPTSSFGAITTGDNIGTAGLQVQGTRKSVTSNSLTVF